MTPGIDRVTWNAADCPKCARFSLVAAGGVLRVGITYALTSLPQAVSVGFTLTAAQQLAGRALVIGEALAASKTAGNNDGPALTHARDLRQGAAGRVDGDDGHVGVHVKRVRLAHGPQLVWVVEAFVHSDRVGNYSVSFYAPVWSEITAQLSYAAGLRRDRPMPG